MVMTAWVLSMALMMSPDAPAAETFTQPVEGLPLPQGASLSKDCDGLMPGAPYCVSLAEADVEAVGGAYLEYFEAEGFTPLGVDDKRVFFLKPRAEGEGCDVVQMLYLRDSRDRQEGPAPSFMSFAAHPGNLCEGMDPKALSQ